MARSLHFRKEKTLFDILGQGRARKEPKMANELPVLPKGWAYVDRANTKGIFAGSRKKKGKVVGEFSVLGPVWVPIPVTAAAQDVAFDKYSNEYDGVDGEVELKGRLAGAAEKYYQSWEILRQLGCDLDEEGIPVTRELLQSKVAQITPLSGKKGGFKKVVASEDKIDELAKDPAKLKAYLKAQGMTIN
jgi:hypothetical protein